MLFPFLRACLECLPSFSGGFRVFMILTRTYVCMYDLPNDFFGILGHIRVLPPPCRQLRRGAAAPLRDLYHNVFAATAFWLQTSTLQAL